MIPVLVLKFPLTSSLRPSWGGGTYTHNLPALCHSNYTFFSTAAKPLDVPFSLFDLQVLRIKSETHDPPDARRLFPTCGGEMCAFVTNLVQTSQIGSLYCLSPATGMSEEIER